MPFDFDDRWHQWRAERDVTGYYLPTPDLELAAVKRADAEWGKRKQTCTECGTEFSWPCLSDRLPLCSALCREKWEEKNGPMLGPPFPPKEDVR